MKSAISSVARNYRLQEWASQISKCQNRTSDISVKEWCRQLSNGFVEGTNNKLKMVKRTMYGRSSKVLLETKLMYGKTVTYG